MDIVTILQLFPSVSLPVWFGFSREEIHGTNFLDPGFTARPRPSAPWQAGKIYRDVGDAFKTVLPVLKL